MSMLYRLVPIIRDSRHSMLYKNCYCHTQRWMLAWCWKLYYSKRWVRFLILGSIATTALSLAVSTQYTNVTDTEPDTARTTAICSHSAKFRQSIRIK